MFIVGDSVTQVAQVSNGEEWYAYLEKEFKNFELFVYGGGGYGSLQEFLVLDDFIDEIRPDVILWQFCSNDYANNVYELDIRSYPYNNHAVRPYLEGEEIKYRLPLPLPVLREYSFIADRVLKIYDRYMWKTTTNDLAEYVERRKLEALEMSNAEKEAVEALQRRAFDVTNKILGKVRDRAGKVPIYLFQGCGPVTERERSICEMHNLTCMPGITDAVKAWERAGYQVKVRNDGHWNKLGNELVGRSLVDYFRGNKILSDR